MKYSYNLTITNPKANARIIGPDKLSRLEMFLAWLYIQSHIFVFALAITTIIMIWR